MTHHVLWIEDSPQRAFSPYLSPILSDPDIALQLAYDATQAFNLLQANPYDLIIFDLDLPPGDNSAFQAIYRFCAPAPEKKSCVLGCYLLQLWMGREPTQLPDGVAAGNLRLPKPLILAQVVVYSVYANNFRDSLKKLGLNDSRIIQKDTNQGRFFLHRRIKSFLEAK